MAQKIISFQCFQMAKFDPFLSLLCNLAQSKERKGSNFAIWQPFLGSLETEGLDVCWLLNLSNAERLKDPSLIWSRIPSRFPRVGHAAVLEPSSQRLWVIGGIDSSREPTSDVLEMTNVLLTLKELALYHAARNFKAGDPCLLSDRFPEKLTNEIEACRSNINAARRVN